MSVTVANTAANISGDTLLTAENAETLTGQKTFSNTVLFSPDNTYDIGASGATRPRDVFIGDDLVVGDGATIGGTLGVTGAVTLSSTLGVTGLVTGRVANWVSSTSTGAQNNWDPGVVNGVTVVQWSNTSDVAITGIESGASNQAGRQIILYNVSASNVMTFAYLSGSSDADNKLFNPVTSAATPVAPKGWIHYVHNGSNWVMAGHDQGAWITPTFAAGDFTAFAAGTWTVASGDVQTMKYRLHGKTLHVVASVITSTVARSGADPTILIISNSQWGGFTNTNSWAAPSFLADNGTPAIGYVTAASAGTNLQNILVNGAQFANATDTTQVRFVIAFEVT